MPYLLLTMLICIVVAVFALQNSLIVPIKFMFVEQSASLVLVILGSAFLGLLIGATILMYVKVKNYWGSRKISEQVEHLTMEHSRLAAENEGLQQQNMALQQQIEQLLTQNKEFARDAQEVPEPNNL